MHVFYLELFQLLIALCYTLITQNIYTAILSILYSCIISSSSLKKFKPSKLVMNFALIISIFIQLSNRIYTEIIQTGTLTSKNILEALTIFLLSALLFFRKFQQEPPYFDNRMVAIVYLLFLGCLPIQKSWQQQLIGVGILILMCWIMKIRNKKEKITMIVVSIVKLFLLIQTSLIYLQRYGYIKDQSIYVAHSKFQEINIFCFIGAIISGDLLIYESFYLPDKKQQQTQIQLQEMEARTMTQAIQISQKSQSQIQQVPNQDIKLQQLKEKQAAQEIDTESYNIVFLIPYFLLPANLFEIPIYAYLIYLQYKKPPQVLRWAMYISLNVILMYYYQPSIKLFLVSISMILVMNWEMSLEGGISNLKALWLRWCFIIVLILLFWFALRKVNIFHLSLSIILLLFVTRGSEDGQRSFRNRNWKYLMLFFNSFLILRYLFYISPIPNLQIFQLLGISFNYNSEYLISDNFNFIPLIMSIVITLQFWTYGSKIYKTDSKQVVGDFVRNYRIFIKRFVTILTIIYYKTLIWAVYIINLLLVLNQTFSVSSGIIIGWTLFMFLIQVSGGSKAFLYKMWKTMSTLLAVLIIIRYFFEFTKFPTVYKIFSKIPMFQFLYNYQHILGLSVDNSAQNYFHTITKFQLMIALDFIQLLLTYLAIDYYNIIKKYHAREELDPVERQKIQDIYLNYIAFKLQDITRNITKIIRGICFIYIRIFYLLIGVYTSASPTIFQLVLVFVILLQYYRLNTTLYNLVAGSGILRKVKDRFRQWYDICKIKNSRELRRIDRNQQEENEQVSVINVQQNKNISQEANKISEDMAKQRIALHAKIRVYLTLVIIIGILLLYSSRVLYEDSLKDFISESSILNLKWYFYMLGTSVERTSGFLGMPVYIIILIMIILEYKACQFQSSFILIEEQRQSPRAIISISTQQLLEKNMRANVLLGLHKLLQRSYVTILVFISNMRSTPSSIFYLMMAFVLNTFGTSSILALSKIQILITYFQFCLMVFNFQNTYIYPNMPAQFQEMTQYYNPFRNLSEEWSNYWTFGKNNLQLGMYVIGIIVIASYQFYFRTMLWTASKILQIMSKNLQKLVGFKLFNMFRNIYTYIIVLCPLIICLTAMAIYILDISLTNIILLAVTGLFLFKQYVSQPLANKQRTRTFWKAYFRLFQILILSIMVLECLLAIPQYSKYCVPLLCNQNKDIRNKIFQCFLVLVFQLGIDTLKSKEYDREMGDWEKRFQLRANMIRIIIANYQNDQRLEVLKKDFMKRKTLKQNLEKLLLFLELLKQNRVLKYEDRCHISPPKQSLLNIFLSYMPSLLDPPVMWDIKTAYKYLLQQNNMMIRLYKQQIRERQNQDLDILDQWKEQVKFIENCYEVKFESEYKDAQDLIEVLNEKRIQFFSNPQNHKSQEHLMSPLVHVDIIPNYNSILEENIRKTIVESHSPDTIDQIQYEQKRKIVQYMFISAIISNWQYITFIIMVLEHLHNNSIITFIFPIIVFVFGMVQQYQASRWIWIISFLYSILFLLLKYSISLGIIKIDPDISLFLVGTNPDSFFLQFLLLISIPIQTLLLQSLGLYKNSISDVERMKTCLIRNLLKLPSSQQDWRHQLQKLLTQISQTQSEGAFEEVFGKSQLKTGVDYSFLLTTVQIVCLIYSFLFYERMFIQNDLSFYSMIEYNQFNGGMVVWMLIQLLLMLIDRFLSILSFRSRDWQIQLIIKHFVLVGSICVINYMLLFNTPSGGNMYTFIFGFIYSLYFLLSALQVRNGINRISRGFMERYTWYNGFIYMGFRAVPFLFQFKVFSDWFVTRTVMRLFDWIKFQDLFGRLFVAKCNALFLQGKIMGSQIEWWKKVLMGLPLLFVIIILLFGPLVLFSTLNPLAQENPIVGGSVYIALSINSSNVYPLYVNSHISKIHTPLISDLSPTIQAVVQNYNIQQQSIQKVNLQSYSDSYWEISQGSQQKLLQEPEQSLYELIMTVKFTRKFTSSTPIYTLSSYIIPSQRVSEFKQTLAGEKPFLIQKMYDNALRLDNNNGLHVLTSSSVDVNMYAEVGKRLDKKYWMIKGGLQFIIVSDKYSKAIFGYSVVGFYLSIILVVANYFRFIFQGSSTTIWLTDIPVADPVLTICEGIYLSRVQKNLQQQDFLYWTLIDLVRSPDTIKLLTGNYLDARKQTLKNSVQYKYEISEPLSPGIEQKKEAEEKQEEEGRYLAAPEPETRLMRRSSGKLKLN